MGIKESILDFFSPCDEFLLIILFGSHASGKATRQSDVDIAYVARDKVSMEERIRFTSGLSRLLQHEVDFIDLDASHGALLQEILTRGIVLVNRSPATYEKLLSRMLREKEDDSRFLAKTVEERKRAWPSPTKP